ncbi:cytochrome P450 2C50-like [Amblyraja radiata]|uniref:cytochrome P450 2C50-like n=1 Tax=Amblyraja radiata TaxID=386614 RepID=UPI0014035AB5|nr:cytochrome P450 2C50-like [Amblyraja radiata]
MLPLVLLAFAALLLALWFCWSRPSPEQRGRRPVPGPRSLPLIGNLADLRRTSLHVHLRRLARTYGPIYRLRLLRQDIIVLNSSELIKEALVKRPAEFAGRPRTFVDIRQ